MTEPDTDQRIPEYIGPYRIMGLLGQGGMGVVYRGEHSVTGDSAAVKTVNIASKIQLTGIRREIQALAQIHHPNIVRILEEGMHGGLPWYAMELLQGITLRHHFWKLILGNDDYDVLIQQKQASSKAGSRPPLTNASSGLEYLETTDLELMDENDAMEDNLPPPDTRHVWIPLLNIIRKICGALAYLHGEGIIHLDLKPENIFIRTNGTPILMDFGLVSRFVGQLSREAFELGNPGMGTLEYMAPELIWGHLVDARADLYSIGVMLYEFITGRVPFKARSADEMVQIHRSTQLIKPSELVGDLPPAIDALIVQLLAIDPHHRLGYASDVVNKLYLQGMSQSLDMEDFHPRSYLYRTSFVGREDIFHDLDARLAELAVNIGSIVLLGGESGIGKTRLAMEVGRYARNYGFHVLVGEASSNANLSPAGDESLGEPLQLFQKPLQMMGDWCREHGQKVCDAVFGERGKLLALYEPSLVDLPGQVAFSDPGQLPPEEAITRLYRALARTFLAYANIQQLVLILDDLQWADDLSRGFLQFLIMNKETHLSNLMIIGTFRFEESTGWLSDLRNAPSVITLKLERFTAREVTTMVTDMLALSEPAPGFITALSQQSDGNPFYIAEYLKTAVEAGLLHRNQDGHWVLASGAEIEGSGDENLPLPGSLREILNHRIDTFKPDVRSIMENFAILGRESDIHSIRKLSGRTEFEIISVIQELLARMIIEEVQIGRFRFMHDQIRRILYDRIPGSQRILKHLKAAKFLETMDAKNKIHHFSEIGRHFEQAKCNQAAQKYFLAGARIAVQKFAHQEGERLYRRYLALITQPLPEGIIARVELSRDILMFNGNTSEVEMELKQAASEAHQIGYAKGLADAMKELANLCWHQGKMEEGDTLGNQALHIYQHLGDRRAESGMLHNLGNAAEHQGRLTSAQMIYQQALSILKKQSDQESMGRILSDLGSLLIAMGRQSDGLDCLQQALAIESRRQDRFGEGRILERLGCAAMREKQIEKATEYLTEAIEIYREIGYRRGEGLALMHLVTILQEVGDHDGALELGDDALAIHREIKDSRSEGLIRFRFGMIFASQGKIDRAMHFFEQALETFVTVQDLLSQGIVLRQMAILTRWNGGPFNTAEEYAHESECIFRKLGNTIEIILSLCERVHIMLAQHLHPLDLMDDLSDLKPKLRGTGEAEVKHPLEKLQRAVIAFEKKQTLIHGECMGDLPEFLRKSQPSF